MLLKTKKKKSKLNNLKNLKINFFIHINIIKKNINTY